MVVVRRIEIISSRPSLEVSFACHKVVVAGVTQRVFALPVSIDLDDLGMVIITIEWDVVTVCDEFNFLSLRTHLIIINYHF